MKRTLCICALMIGCTGFLSATSSFAMSGDILRPSLTTTMQQNSILAQKNFKAETLRKKQELAKEKRDVALAKIQTRKITKNIKTTNPPIVFQKKSTELLPVVPPPITNTTQKVSTPVSAGITDIPNVDMSRVRSTWIGWYNSTRAEIGLSPYKYDNRLDMTAHDWNMQLAAGKGANHHRRHPNDSYYDFPVIDQWFKDRGVDPKVVNRAKHTENVGYGSYSCNSGDCTDSLIAAIRSTYNFFMSEKGKTYDAHYKSIVNPSFTKIGMDIIVEPSSRQYYITIHYITE